MDNHDLTQIEMGLLLQAIKQFHHWNFMHYKKASLKRRIMKTLEETGLTHISELIPLVLHDSVFLHQLIENISVPVTEMFRNPEVFKVIRNEIIPVLKTYPYLKIWHAGCASGKEVYSMAILLQEENLYDRTELVGTDINQASLRHARDGIYRANEIREYSRNYRQAGGQRELLDYFHLTFENAIINNSLKKNVHFKFHDLTRNEPVNDVLFILCRNVFIYFDRYLQDHAIKLFLESLRPGGFLCLGSKESLQHSKYYDHFEPLNLKLNIYRKRYE